MNLAVGAIVATLWYSEWRLMRPPLDCSLHDVLENLVVRVDAASRAYGMAYVGFFASVMAVLPVTEWWRAGLWRLVHGRTRQGWTGRSVGAPERACLGGTHVRRPIGPSWPTASEGSTDSNVTFRRRLPWPEWRFVTVRFEFLDSTPSVWRRSSAVRYRPT